MNYTARKFIGVSLIVIGIVGVAYILIRSTLYSPDTELSPNSASVIAGDILAPGTTAEEVDPSEYPSRLLIPRIGVDAAVQHVGVKENGNMANPSNFTDVGWYRLGTVPGYTGSAVVAGHVDNALALDGVFKELPSLREGDEVVVRDRKGEEHRFRVDRVETYDYLNAPAKEIFTSPDGKKHLNLITCGGTWIRSAQSYDERIVVYTTMVE